MKKERILKFFIPATIIIVASVLIESFFFNFRSIFQGNNHSIPEVSYETRDDDKNTILEFNTDQMFVRKLSISYKTTENTPYTVTYNKTREYGLTERASSNDVFENHFEKAVINIEQTASNISVSFAKDAEVNIEQISIDNDFHFNILRFIFINLVLSTLYCLFIFYKQGFKTEKLHIYFATIASLLGLMFIVAQPAASFYSWDDQIHFDRALNFLGGTTSYNIGEYNNGELINPLEVAGRDTITSIEEQFAQNELFSSSKETVATKKTVDSPYDRLAYVPMTSGYYSAKVFGLPFTACFYIGKIFNLLFYILLMAYAIKTLITGKLLLFVIAILPTNLFLACSYSYDPMVFSCISIFLAHIINLFLVKTKKVDFKTLLVMLVSIAIASLAKAPYAVLLLLVLFIPKPQFSVPEKTKWIKFGTLFMIPLLLGFLFLPMLGGKKIDDPRGGDVSAKDQAMYILKNPIDYANILERTAGENFAYNLLSPGVVSNFGYIGALSYVNNIYYILITVLLFVGFTDNKNNKLGLKQRLLILSPILLSIILIWSALYVVFTPAGDNTIAGVQCRYFIPFLFPLLLIIQPKNLVNRIRTNLNNSIPILIVSVATIALVYFMILVRYSF